MLRFSKFKALKCILSFQIKLLRNRLSKECTVIFNKIAKQWGSGKYDEKEDQLRVKVKPEAVKSSSEKLIYTIAKNKIVLSWDKWNIPLSVK